MVEIDSSVQMIILQFSFSNGKAVPEWIGCHEKEVPQERTERKNRLHGELVIEKTKSCSVLNLAKDLGVAGYELVDAFCQKRINPKYPNKRYQMVRFVFVRNEDMQLPDNFMNKRVPALGSLREMCAAAMWRARVFLNPYYENGEKIPNKHAISINLDVRRPLRPPIMVWPRDENNRKMKGVPGVEKIRLMPDCHLRVEDNILSLVNIT